MMFPKIKAFNSEKVHSLQHYLMRKNSLNLYILPPVAVSMLIIMGAFILSYSQRQQQRLEEIRSAIHKQVEDLMLDELQQSVDKMELATDLLTQSTELETALAAHDKEALRTLSMPLFGHMRDEHEITHFYYHDLNRINLLRLHGTLQGDLINRKSMLQAQNTGHPGIALEQGKTGNAVLRVVHPWQNASGEVLGYVELGMDFNDIADEISHLLGIDILVVVDKQFLERELWQKQALNLSKESYWDDFTDRVIVDRTLPEVPEQLQAALAEIPLGTESAQQLTLVSGVYQTLGLPLKDFDGEQLGTIVVLKEITPIVADARQSVLRFSLLCLGIGAGLFVFFYWLLKRLRKTQQQLEGSNTALEESLGQLQQTQLHMVQSEKMSALGSLVAGVAHEINNPINFIHGNLSHLDTYTQDLLTLIQFYQEDCGAPSERIADCLEEADIEFLTEDLEKILQSIRLGTNRVREIVLSLRNFSRLDEAEVKDVNIHDGLDSTLTILHHRLKAQSHRPEIEVVRNYSNLPRVECYAGQLNQVFMNLFSNAIDALEEAGQDRSLADWKAAPGIISVTTQATQAGSVQIQIADNGPGIPDAVKANIFNPFFTTKSVGQGTGLGLSISYQIITEKHHGKVWCESTPERGTTFIIELPIQQDQALTTGAEGLPRSERSVLHFE
jgi:signal transduction histidine kinase